ncbi:hypothetical protein [Lachnoclostridium phytofermentans]|uniref:Uncharacterized protein n=1 Tax=Lachnoclostridium phytofermentans (strain ATCC 700394 / DSM 18823 / ISDg) TaxID=357809 RepID=A9KS27_LACP7|nr:hypothetical protein [Lachnoclostridium phytofermentans]ABX40658.1 hypothetical protein Cphy_0271 [Lachnoclostridium phytofermentans ISDg]
MESENINSEWNKQIVNHRQYNKICSKHGSVLVKSPNSKCRRCIEEMKNNYNDLNHNGIVKIIEKLKNKYDVIMVPTYIPEGSVRWNGRRKNFENPLSEIYNLYYFVYIKFCVNKEGVIRALVAGKTGSKKVNYSGSDINFFESVNHGEARKLLKEKNMKWYKDEILVIKADDEDSAYRIENEVQECFNLFGS